MDTSFDYSAFISYKREDEKWAVWLQNRLERYSIPASVRKEIPRLPKHIDPVFRDETDLGGGGLTASIHNELERSHFLIVICSPRSAASDWVGKEIKYFKDDLGREDLIIPFIIDGIPHCEDKSKECFHPIFKDFKDEPLGINVNEIGKQRAVVKVLARILDLKFDALWQRHERYKRKKRYLIALSVLLAFCVGLLFWQYKKPMYEYYVDYVDKWGVPQGVIKVDISNLRHRSRTYRFEYRRIPIGEDNALDKRLSKIEYINSAGVIQNHDHPEMNYRYAIQKLQYNSSTGELEYIDFCDRTGKVQVRWKIASKDGKQASLIDLIGTSNYEASSYLTSMSTRETVGFLSKTVINRFVLVRDTSGYIIEQSFHKNNDDDIESTKTTDENGVYKQTFVNDSLGRVLTTTYYDINEAIIKRKDGVAIREYDYDSNGAISQVSYYNSDHEPTLNEMLCSRIAYESDKNGNIVRECYYGTTGRLCYNKDHVSQKVIEYDNNGFHTSIACLDANNLLCNNNEGVSKIIVKNNSRGNQIEIINEDITGKSCTNKDGFAKIEIDYDRWGNPTYMAYYGLDGNLTHNEVGISGWTAKYDRFGNCYQCDFIDKEWNKGSDIYGNSGVRDEYDKRGHLRKRTFIDKYDKECVCSLGYSSCEWKYDDRGNMYECSYFSNGTPCRNNYGFHKVIFGFDKYGNLVDYSYYGPDGALCNCKDGFAICKAKTDSVGHIIQCHYFDSSKHPTQNADGIERFTCEYDAFGRKTSVRFYNCEGFLTLNKEKIAGWDAEYDSRGNIVELRLLDIDENPCCDTSGLARWVAKFDERGNQTLYASYNENSRLVSLNNGVALWKAEYNDRGLLVRTSYFDENEKPCINTDVGFFCYTAEYDERGNLTEECTYNDKNQLCINPACGYARWTAEYDTKGNKIKMSSYSENDSLCVCNHGYAEWIAQYDKDGYFEKSVSYDANGNVISNNEENNETIVNDVKAYDSHRFRFDKKGVVFALFFMLVSLFFMVVWIVNISNDTKWEILGWTAYHIIMLNGLFVYLQDFLLHYKLIPYVIHNYCWVLNLFTSIICVSAIVFFLVQFGTTIASIIKKSKYSFSFYNRKQLIRQSIDALVFHIMAATFFAIALSYFTYEGWMIYSNPL